MVLGLCYFNGSSWRTAMFGIFQTFAQNWIVNVWQKPGKPHCKLDSSVAFKFSMGSGKISWIRMDF
jgi:hypothetical protein